jgi:hypothetical protein
MTKVLIYVTVIFALFAIPITTIYWWPGFWGFQADYWYPWIPWLGIASAVIAGLWLLRLILWVRDRRPAVRFHRDIPTCECTAPHSTSDEPVGEADWIVDEHGQARRPNYKPQGESESYPVPESLDDDPLSQADKYIRETKKLAEHLTDGRRILNRWRF